MFKRNYNKDKDKPHFKNRRIGGGGGGGEYNNNINNLKSI